MKEGDYPALFRSADSSSNSAQATYLWLIRLLYSLLLAAAVVAVLAPTKLLLIIYAVFVAASTALLIYMAVRKPEKDWYACRALAESIKTATWRFMMRAEPFEDVKKVSEARGRLAHFLSEILKANKHVDDAISRHPVAGEQISKTMSDVRDLTLLERIELYRVERIEDQKSWYVAKAKTNKLQFLLWVIFCVCVQGLAIILALTRIAFEEALWVWPTEPLLVLASAVVGWIQIKKFNELASAYSLTAHEISIVQTRIVSVGSEDEFSEFVNEAELAFSREHTQWVARQNE